MSFKVNQSQQLTLDDSFLNLSLRTQKIVMNSWAKDFALIKVQFLNESDDQFLNIVARSSNLTPEPYLFVRTFSR